MINTHDVKDVGHQIEKNIDPTETHIVPKLPAPIRLQEYGVGIFKLVSTKSAIKKALKKRFITVNDIIATTATFIHGGESIQLFILEDVLAKRKLAFPLNVVFEDEYLAVIRKHFRR